MTAYVILAAVHRGPVLAAVSRGMIAGGGFDCYLLVKAMAADSLLEVGEVYDVVDGLPFLETKLETLNVIMKRPY